jgi:hypothetical protein
MEKQRTLEQAQRQGKLDESALITEILKQSAEEDE